MFTCLGMGSYGAAYKIGKKDGTMSDNGQFASVINAFATFATQKNATFHFIAEGIRVKKEDGKQIITTDRGENNKYEEIYKGKKEYQNKGIANDNIIKTALHACINNLLTENKDFNCGVVKMLTNESSYNDEIEGFIVSEKSGKSIAPCKEGQYIGFTLAIVGNDHHFQGTNIHKGYTKSFKTNALFFVFMKELQPLSTFKKDWVATKATDKEIIPQTKNYPKDITGFNKLCFDRLIAPLTAQLNGLHAAGFYHRDIKPENIMYDTDSHEAVLIDYGMHKHEFGGTRDYMSPGIFFHNEIRGKRVQNYTNQSQILPALKVHMNLDFFYNNFFQLRSVTSFIDNFLKCVNSIIGTGATVATVATDEDKLNALKAFIFKKNDFYGLGLSLAQECGALLPMIPEVYEPKKHWLTGAVVGSDPSKLSAARYRAYESARSMSIEYMLFVTSKLNRKSHIVVHGLDYTDLTYPSAPKVQDREITGYDMANNPLWIDKTNPKLTTENLYKMMLYDSNARLRRQQGGGGIGVGVQKKCQRVVIGKEFVFGRERKVFQMGGNKKKYVQIKGKNVPLRDAQKFEKELEKYKRELSGSQPKREQMQPKRELSGSRSSKRAIK